MRFSVRLAFNTGHVFSRVMILTGSLAAALVLSGPATASAWVFGNGNSYTNPKSMSADGRYVAFQSDATNLVLNDTNGLTDIFRLDTQTGAVVRVSVNSSGNQSTGGRRSTSPVINSDGTKIAFISDATNLVAGDTNNAQDVFLRDLSAGTTVRANVSSSGAQASNLSKSFDLWISADGTKVAFSSQATNLIPGDTNGNPDIFIRDVSAGTTVRVSLDSSGNQVAVGGCYTPSISPDGTKVAFESGSPNVVPDDTNGLDDIFVRDLVTSTTVRISVDSAGNQANNGSSNSPTFNADGTKIAFSSAAKNLVADDTNNVRDVFVRDLSAGTTVRASVSSSGVQANLESNAVSISADGTKVSFMSEANTLVAGDTNGKWDVFVRDLSTNTTVLASVNSSGDQGNNYSDLPSISADGTRVAFCSVATNLVPGDTNSKWDVFVHDFAANSTSVPVTLSGFKLE